MVIIASNRKIEKLYMFLPRNYIPFVFYLKNDDCRYVYRTAGKISLPL
jgi:hypothetical protein